MLEGLLVAVAFAIDVAAIFIDALGGFEDVLHAHLLAGAAGTIGVLSLACFARAVPPRQGLPARRGALILWVLIASSAAFFWVVRVVAWLVEFGHPGIWVSLAFLAMWTAFGWAVGVRPLERGSRAARIGPVLAGIGCIVSLIVGLALSWGSLDVYDRGNVAFEVAALLALCAAALSIGVPHGYPVDE
jgi:hypothetical protein